MLDRLVQYNAATGWRLVLALHRLGADDLAAFGEPLERLLHHHGARVIDEILDLARLDALFRAKLAPLEGARQVPLALLERIGLVCGWIPRQRRDLSAEMKSAYDIATLEIDPPRDAQAWRVIDATRSDAEIMLLAQTWLESQTLSWAFTEVSDVIADGTVDASWALLLEMVAASDDDLLGDVAAGPLEDFLGKQGEVWIERVEAAARSDPKLRAALRGVWRNRMADDVWERVQAARQDPER